MSEPEYPSSSEYSNDWINLLNGRILREISAEDAKNIVSPSAGGDLPGATLEELRDMSVGRMQSSLLQREERVLWGEVAILCARRKKAIGVVDPLASAAEEARVRVYIIHEFGEIDRGEFWSLARLCEFVLNSISCSLEDVRAKASSWRDLNREEILSLRRVKNLLNAMKSVEELLQGEGGVCADVRTWLGTIPQLP
ncbi:hypothetical protein [Streptomyces megasporus]|uniref:hypothetical protein n=1 Tax=Streptomyces megasporus TaxID=44060 RepID=UPI0012FF473C|nr:hypothetical protein [Streptomyces megasporus]